MLPDCKSEYNNASALPGERNITLFTALLCPKKRLEKQPVSLARWDPGAEVIAMRGAIIRAGRHAEAVWHYSKLLSAASSRLHERHSTTPVM